MSRQLVLTIFFSLASGLLYADSDTVRIENKTDLIELGGRMEYFLDPTSQFSVHEIHLKYREGAFFRAYGDAPNFTGQPGTIWFRFVLKNVIGEDAALCFPNVLIEDLDIYFYEQDSIVYQKSTGFAGSFFSRDFLASDYIVAVPTTHDAGAIVIIYGSIKAPANPPMLMVMSAGAERAVLAKSRASELISISVLGALLVMFLYNLCLAIMIGDRLYFFYCFYIFTSVVVIVWLNGYLVEWFGQSSPGVTRYPWPMGMFLLAQLFFANQLLRIKEELPAYFRFSLVIYAGTLAIIASPVLPLQWMNGLIAMICILLPIYFLVVSVRLCVARVQMAYVFVIGWLPILIITILNGLSLRGAMQYNWLLDLHAVELSLTWELVVFSLALGFRYNIMRSEKLVAQATNFRILDEQKSTLRKLVIEQTEEIMAQNDQLLRNQEEIKLQNERLETQNKAYERLKEMILRQNHELETSVQRRTLQLAQSNEELKKHVHQLEQFSFIAAHNLRAPVARILGLVNILDYANPANRENASILKKIVASARDLDVIIHDLGAILEAQKNKIDKTECVDIHQLIEKIINRHKPDIDSAGILIEKSIGAACIVGVPAYLDSILSNLISNSIKYRADQRKPIILIATEENAAEATIIVHDNGIGFDSKLFNHKIFEPFQRFHTHKDGKGLGMFLVKTHVIAMNGTIALTSEPNVGTHIIITLPKAERLPSLLN